MKTVRLTDNVVVEIIPQYALPVEKWYGMEFAAQCMEAPDDAEQGWVYNPETGLFGAPVVTKTEHHATAKQREEAYNTQPIVEWDGELLTVTQAATKWQYYAAEGDSVKADELTVLIAAAKQIIRAQYPDEGVST